MTPYVPLSRRVTCEGCFETIDSTAPSVARLATAWIPNRREGGPNTLVDPYWHERWRCPTCVDLLREDRRWDQPSLFGPPS